MSVKNLNEQFNYVGFTTQEAGLEFDPVDAEVRDVLFVRMTEDVQLSLQQQTLAYMKIPYRKIIIIPSDYKDDIYMPYDIPKIPPRNSFLNWFKRG